MTSRGNDERWTVEEYEAYFDSLVRDMDDATLAELEAAHRRATRRECVLRRTAASGTDSTKDLGQIAEEEWHLVIRESENRWRHTDREAWQAAADAVMHEVIHGVQWDYMPPQVRDVVEAARRWWMYGEWSKEHDDAKIALCKAVEALEEIGRANV